MTPDEIRELRCECGHEALALHSHICWSSICRCERSVAEVLASALTERLRAERDAGELEGYRSAYRYVHRLLGDESHEVIEDHVTERLAQAWDEGYSSGFSNAMRRMSDEPYAPTTANPCRSHADSGRSAGALSDEQGSVRVRGSLKPCRDRNSNVCVAEGCYGEACLNNEGTPR